MNLSFYLVRSSRGKSQVLFDSKTFYCFENKRNNIDFIGRIKHNSKPADLEGLWGRKAVPLVRVKISFWF